MTKVYFKNHRSIAVLKSISWRVIASLTTFFLTWAITGELAMGVLVGGADALIKMFLYYGHERFWYHLAEVKEAPRATQEA